ncbi:hypothetical protein [Stakelama marina]|uniref:Uncharacterized protein n=1 Tax=Stakelama marina TaxID=2826939 RepID=A0A8T4INZ2_9SPHN|nr:hypothetical protein [Stakelama marina]MBR0553846.1 hypothetical protein [Stakelama marina]
METTMPKKTLEQVAEDETIHKLAPIAEFVEINVGHRLNLDHDRRMPGDMSLKKVWGVKEARTQLPTLLREASAGEIHFVTAGNGATIVIMSAKNLADAMTTLEDRRGLTLADAVSRLPYAPTELKSPARRHRPPERGLLRRARLVEQA